MNWSRCAHIALVISAVGCGDGVKSQLAQRATPSAAASRAIVAYDKDGDGILSAQELEAAPALAIALPRFDADKDGALTATELQQRFEAYELGPDLIAVSMTVYGPKGLLVGANVTLTPEPYMGEGLQSYSGVTTEGGGCNLKGSETELPGLPVGLYQAHAVQAEQGLDKVIGCEIAREVGNRVELKL